MPTAPALTPGEYLSRRRRAAGLSIEDVAANLSTEPRIAEAARIGWVKLLELDVARARFSTIAALRARYQFDIGVLARLDLIRQGFDLKAPQLCRVCACSWEDACDDGGQGCHWHDAQRTICSACVATDPAIEVRPGYRGADPAVVMDMLGGIGR